MSVATVTTAVRRWVQDEPWEDYLSAPYTAGQTILSVEQPTAWEEGDILDFADGEQMRVKTTPTANPLAVKYAHNDTTNANHASGDVALKGPRYGTHEITSAITHVTENWLFPDVFVAREATLVPSSSTVIYELPSDFEDVISIVQTASGTVDDVLWVTDYRVLPPVDAAHATSRKALRVASWPRNDANATLVYAARPSTSTMTTDMEPVIALGVAAMLLKAEALEVSERAPDEDDRPFRHIRTARELERAFQEEKRRLRSRLLAQYGGPGRRFIR